MEFYGNCTIYAALNHNNNHCISAYRTELSTPIWPVNVATYRASQNTVILHHSLFQVRSLQAHATLHMPSSVCTVQCAVAPRWKVFIQRLKMVSAF